ncbi:Spy/CpxP family protein refolding chaperone [Silvibacterium bohemicum]|uniref:Spy/CpxP family protein refolding chaperone n=1 Tax=Silvibacterium bohemicum TaxID=1577686 RepID=A0A841K307_9BACT|nr:Spy/CpxP family protein refolding chaperone [Silvibacterium bohemicum]MBB6145541.1 Spy/CpxP family protein refolding chaperone [Silvibacterium bohemicum]
MLLSKRKSSALGVSLAFALCMASGTALVAQDWHGGDRGPGSPPMERSFHGMEHGRWWNNPRVAQQIGITDDQKKKMDDIFQQHRLKLIDLNASLEKQEAIMHPLIEADQPDESKILSQIDAIAQARAELEKDRARMLFSIRQTLTPDQWKKLQALVHQGPQRGDRDGRGRDGQGRDGQGWGRGNRGPSGPGGPGGPGRPDGGAPNGQQPPPPTGPSGEDME